MSNPTMRAPSAARASATARPCPWAAPVMKATFPLNSPFAIGIEIFIQIHLEDIINDIRRHHQAGKSCQSHQLLLIEEASHVRINIIRNSISLSRNGASELDDRLAFFVQL